jgi:1,4-dihydroxy-2-naphthoate octaprenyltransferase
VGLIKKTFARRLSGDRPSPVGAAVASVVVGAAAAVLTYKTLRS